MYDCDRVAAFSRLFDPFLFRAGARCALASARALQRSAAGFSMTSPSGQRGQTGEPEITTNIGAQRWRCRRYLNHKEAAHLRDRQR